MNKTFKKVITGAALIFMVTGCASKCDFAEFKEKYNAAQAKGEEEVKDIEKIAVKGKYNGESYNFTVSEDTADDLSIKETLVFAAVEAYTLAGYALAEVEDKSATYYAGSTFKIETEKVTYEFDKYGVVSAVKDDKSDFTIKTTYIKK